jgi:hypothetical protein
LLTVSLGLRGQAADINALFGFRLECIERLGDQQGVWAWTRLNSLFNWLPLAALIEDRIICMHGGAQHSLCTAWSLLCSSALLKKRISGSRATHAHAETAPRCADAL